MKHKYNQELPVKVEKDLDAYIERIKNIKWFNPSPDLKKETVDTAVKATLSDFGVEASIEYRSLKTEADFDAAWDAARDAAWGAAWGAADILATHTNTYKLKTPFLRLVDLWEMGMYPCGVIDGKFVVYSPIDFDEPKETVAVHEVLIDGVVYVPKV